MITDVTTSPTHRRRGLLKRLIEDDLADAVAQGVPVAALTASEATIYGRWGFGPATFDMTIELDASPGFALRDFTDPGRVELVEPADAWAHVKGVFDTFHARQRGSVEWPAQYKDIHTGAYDFNDRSPNSKVRAAVHLDADGDDRRLRRLLARGEGRDQGRGDGRPQPRRPAQPLVLPGHRRTW